MKRLIAVLVLLAVLLATAWTSEYIPLTDDQVMSYWGGLTEMERIAEIRKLDNIENAIPEINLPVPVAILVGRDLHIVYKSGDRAVGFFDISIAGELAYEVELLPVSVKNFVPFDLQGRLMWFASGLVGGIIAGIFASGFF